MPTAIGAYAVPANVLKRIGSPTLTADETAVLTSLCNGINGWIESPLVTGRVLAPIASATYLFDSGDWSDGGRLLWFRNGIRTVTSLRLSAGTGQPLQAVPATEYVLLPRAQDRPTGWPATRLFLHNGGGTSPFSEVSAGYGTAELVMTAGFEDIPDEITELAETAVVRAWHGRMAGQQDIIGSDETGAPIVSRFVSAKDRELLDSYRWRRGVR